MDVIWLDLEVQMEEMHICKERLSIFAAPIQPLYTQDTGMCLDVDRHYKHSQEMCESTLRPTLAPRVTFAVLKK